MMEFLIETRDYGGVGRGLTTGIANVCVETGQLARNQARMVAALDAFAAEGVNLALFPEYGLSGICLPEDPDTPAYLERANLQAQLPWLRETVAPYLAGGMEYIAVNGMAPDGCGGFYNVTLVMDDSGRIELEPSRTYRKTFLPGLEKKLAVSGVNDRLVLDTPYGRMGFLTCYDICFPQLITELVYDEHVDILVVLSAWRRQGKREYPGLDVREDWIYQRQWETLLPALAYQYQVWLLAANAVGPHAEAGSDYCGCSGIWAPSGLELMKGSDSRESLLILKNMDIRRALDIERLSFSCVAYYSETRGCV